MSEESSALFTRLNSLGLLPTSILSTPETDVPKIRCSLRDICGVVVALQRVAKACAIPSANIRPLVVAIATSTDNEVGSKPRREGDPARGTKPITLKGFQDYLTSVGRLDYYSRTNGNRPGVVDNDGNPDYYKYRGTWIIQVTGRTNVLLCIGWLRSRMKFLPSPVRVILAKKDDDITSSDLDYLGRDLITNFFAPFAYVATVPSFKKRITDAAFGSDDLVVIAKVLGSIGYNNKKKSARLSHVPSLTDMIARSAIVSGIYDRLVKNNHLKQ